MNRSVESQRWIELTAGPLCVRFTWHDDRLAHSLACHGPFESRKHSEASRRAVDESQILLQSVEGDAQLRWPPHPPLQQIDVAHGPEGQATQLLLVGMAGTSHWSLTVAADSQNPQQIVFDVACRVREQPVWLGSSYELGADVEAMPRSDSTIELETHSTRWVIEGEGAGETCVVEPDERRVIIRPRVLPKQLPGTVRWRYRIGR